MKLLSKQAAIASAIDEAITKVAAVAREVNIPGAYIAGGWVRDKLLGKDSKDVDITVENGKGIELAEAVANAVGYKMDPIKDVYKAKGTAKVLVPTSNGRLLVEFVSARKETYAPEGHKPTEVKPGTIEDDVLRRDFTLNSLIVNIQDYHAGLSKDEFKNIVKDITGKGISDLEKGILRTPLNPITTFEDDPTRIARAIRFCAQKGFRLAPEVEEAIKNGKASSGELLREMLVEGRKAPKGAQIGDELRKAFLGNPIKTVQLLKDTGLGDSLGMKLDKLDVEQTDYRGLHSKNVYQHSLQALENMIEQVTESKVAGQVFDEERELALYLGALYHDIGKQESQQIVCGGKVNEQGGLTKCDYEYKPGEDYSVCPRCGARGRAKIQFIGHEFRSRDLIDPSLGKFFGNKVRDKVKNLVVNHMAHHNYSRDREVELEKLYRMLERAIKNKQSGQNINYDTEKVKQLEDEIKRKEALVDIPQSRKELARLVEIYSEDPDIKFLWKADLTTKDREHKTQRKKNIDKMIDAFTAFGPVQSPIDGDEVMEIFNIRPGPLVKKVLEQLKDLKIKNPKYSEAEEVRNYLKDKQLNEVGLIIPKRPILDGKDLMDLYEKSPGSWLQPILQRLREETLKGTFKTKDEAIKWLNEHESEFGNIKESVLKSLSKTARIIDEELQDYLIHQPESGMGYQCVDVVLEDGTKLENRIVYNCSQIDLAEDSEIRSLSIKAEWKKEWQLCPKCEQRTYLKLENPITGKTKYNCTNCGYPSYSFGKGNLPKTEPPPGFFEALKNGDFEKATAIAEEYAKENPPDPEQLNLFKGLSSQVNIRGLSSEAAYWSEVELQKAKEYFLQQRTKGRRDDGLIYEEIAREIKRTPRAVKQKIESLKNSDEHFEKFKLKHWKYEDIMKALKDTYRSDPENFHRTALPEDLRSQIKYHIGDWFHNFDLAMAKAIREVEREKNHDITMDEALKLYLHQHKLAHRWNKEEIIGLFKAAHELGLPVTSNFFAKQPEVYKPILGINRSLEGLKDSVKRHFSSWGDAVIEAGLVDNKYYNEEGKILGSTEEVRLARFFDLNNIRYRRCTAMDKIAISDPEILELGYKNFLGDFYIVNEQGKDVALVEVFGSLINSGKMNPEKNKTIGELYKEKREAKIKYYSKLSMPFVYIDNDEEKGLSDDVLKERFATYIVTGGKVKNLSRVEDKRTKANGTLKGLSDRS